jgi:hypothetical protein
MDTVEPVMIDALNFRYLVYRNSDKLFEPSIWGTVAESCSYKRDISSSWVQSDQWSSRHAMAKSKMGDFLVVDNKTSWKLSGIHVSNKTTGFPPVKDELEGQVWLDLIPRWTLRGDAILDLERRGIVNLYQERSESRKRIAAATNVPERERWYISRDKALCSSSKSSKVGFDWNDASAAILVHLRILCSTDMPAAFPNLPSTDERQTKEPHKR